MWSWAVASVCKSVRICWVRLWCREGMGVREKVVKGVRMSGGLQGVGLGPAR
ncbi:hypothetical protein GCM10009603_58990 [Nocardiopsis exhalans]